MNNLLIISCIFGKKFKYVHKSPDNKNSYFFTNNSNLKDEIINKGWNYILSYRSLGLFMAAFYAGCNKYDTSDN